MIGMGVNSEVVVVAIYVSPCVLKQPKIMTCGDKSILKEQFFYS